MAEKKKAPVERKIVEVNGKAGSGGNAAAATGSASGKRITAVILWVLALGAEFLAYALLSGFGRFGGRSDLGCNSLTDVEKGQPY